MSRRGKCYRSRIVCLKQAYPMRGWRRNANTMRIRTSVREASAKRGLVEGQRRNRKESGPTATDTTGNGSMGNDTAPEFLSGQTGSTCMWDSGTKTPDTETAICSVTMEVDSRVSGNTTKNMDTVPKSGPTDGCTRANGNTAKGTDTVPKRIPREMCSQESGKTIGNTATAYTFAPAVKDWKEGTSVGNFVTARQKSATEYRTQASGNTVTRTATVAADIQTERCTRGNGKGGKPAEKQS